jgi:hypothetical protein
MGFEPTTFSLEGKNNDKDSIDLNVSNNLKNILSAFREYLDEKYSG